MADAQASAPGAHSLGSFAGSVARTRLASPILLNVYSLALIGNALAENAGGVHRRLRGPDHDSHRGDLHRYPQSRGAQALVTTIWFRFPCAHVRDTFDLRGQSPSAEAPRVAAVDCPCFDPLYPLTHPSTQRARLTPPKVFPEDLDHGT